MARVRVIHSVSKFYGKSQLCFQWCLYDYETGNQDENEMGYRFIWKNEEGKLLASRGQARIPNIRYINELIEEAKKQGWANKE